MATTTISAVVDSDWASLVDGANFATCHIQVTSPQSLALAVSDTEPDSDADGFIIFTSDQPLFPFTLETSEKIWGRASGGTVTVRIIQTEVSP